MVPYHAAGRQIHLDYHNSPLIPGIAADFDPDDFAQTLAEAHINSVCVFAVCAQGMSYYPTKVGMPHPHLARPDLLGEMIEALHRRSIRAPIYCCIGWEERISQDFPQWRSLNADGTYANIALSADNVTRQPAQWKYNCLAHPEYHDYIEAYINEILDGYDVDGMFIDIVMMPVNGDFHDVCRRERADGGYSDDAAGLIRYESDTQARFCQRFSQQVLGRHPGANLFFNSHNLAFTDHRYGWRARQAYQTHAEIESLPSGFWGYSHFPRLGRQAAGWGDKAFNGMTGRFQKMWGDFGGIKPNAALEYECFRTQAIGGLCSVGDQLHPRGTLDAGAYRLIGDVYKQVAEAEPFYENTTPAPQAAIYATLTAGDDPHGAERALEAANTLCEELRLEALVIDDADDLDGYELVILPDRVTVTEALIAKLKAYHAAGGKVLLSHRSGFDASGAFRLDAFPLRFLGDEPIVPNYWNWPADAPADFRVVYTQGKRLAEPEAPARTLIKRSPSYFNRTDFAFCSHYQTPPDPTAPTRPAAIAGPGFVYFADPVFHEYRESGSVYMREAVALAINELGVTPIVGDGLDLHVRAYARRLGDDLRLTLLNYLPSRKCFAIDVIDDALSFAGQTLRFDRPVETVRVRDGEPLAQSEANGFTLPAHARGRLLLEVPGFYASR
ncbi:MAG: alpha-amylase family protein [Planctomycetota bacterium]